MRNRNNSKSDTVKTEQIRSSTEAYGEILEEGVFPFIFTFILECSFIYKIKRADPTCL